MNVAALIAAKRDGRELDSRDISLLIEGYARETVPDYQMAAFAMAVFCCGMTPAETGAMTRAMLNSGQVMSWPTGNPVVDKHSTGGVGDKISIPLTPILAEFGMRVPMISGRGLGATGGTIDKLESIPGYRTNLSLEEIRDVVESTGCVITAATAEIAPADKRLYALRDVTATVPSIPLITASILSKKLAEGLDSLVLDVKWGSGAFMKTLERARLLARSLVDTAAEMGVRATALITDMNRPLGRWIGNAAEVNESVAILQGTGPADSTQLTELLAVELLVMTGIESDRAAALDKVRQSVNSGRALRRLHDMVAAQGGNLDAPRPLHEAREWVAQRDGFVGPVDCEQLGWALIEMGGGRKKLGDPVDFASAMEMLVQPGERVVRGQPLLRVCYNGAIDGLLRRCLETAVPVADRPPENGPLVVEEISASSQQES